MLNILRQAAITEVEEAYMYTGNPGVRVKDVTFELSYDTIVQAGAEMTNGVRFYTEIT